jgi:hypothetical protein
MKKKKSVGDHESPSGCEKSKLTFSLDNRDTDDGEDVRITRRPLFTPHTNSWYSFLLEAELTPEP